MSDAGVARPMIRGAAAISRVGSNYSQIRITQPARDSALEVLDLSD